MSVAKYVRVKLKQGKSFWAIVEQKGSLLTLYLPVNKEGDDQSYWSEKKKAYIIKKMLVQNSLIESEKPAIESLFYGWLVLDTPENRKINTEVIATSQRQKLPSKQIPRITPKTPRLKR